MLGIDFHIQTISTIPSSSNHSICVEIVTALKVIQSFGMGS